MKKQPAKKSFFFDEGYRKVGRAFVGAWASTFDPRAMKRIFSNFFTFIPNLIVFLIITAGRIVINIVLSIFLAAIFLSIAPLVWISYITVGFLDFLYRQIRRMSVVCTICQRRSDLPVYICPNCKVEHTRLVPSEYGILYRTCNCGHKLPTTFFNGRHKLDSHCQYCPTPTPGGGRQMEIVIPVIGGPGSGKTCLVSTALNSIENSPVLKSTHNVDITGLTKTDYEEIITDMNSGYLPPKTRDMELKYYQFYFTPKTEKIPRLVSLCDVGGEVFKKDSLAEKQIGFRYANSFLIVIDPLAITEYRRELERKNVNVVAYKPSDLAVDQMLARFISLLDNFRGSKKGGSVKNDVAIVFTKCDIPGLDAEIGKSAAAYYASHNGVTQEQAQNKLCEDFLVKYGEANFVQTINSRFKNVRYFTCTSLGGVNRTKFAPEDVDKPVLWLIDRAVAYIKRK